MKRFLLFGFSCIMLCACANEPQQVTVDEDFNVNEVIERLDEHMTNLQTWYATAKRSAKTTKTDHKFDMAVLGGTVAVTHPLLQDCFAKMEEQQSPEPLFVVWNEFKQDHSDSPEDKLFCKEAALLDVHLYNAMISQLQRTGTRMSVDEMIMLYRLISQMPIYELLALLDSIAREIINLLDQTYHGETSFFSWLWNNWWVPPTIISNAVTALIDGVNEILAERDDDGEATAAETASGMPDVVITDEAIEVAQAAVEAGQA